MQSAGYLLRFLAVSAGAARRCFATSATSSLRMNRQHQPHLCSTADVAVDVNVPSMITNGAIDNTHAQPGSPLVVPRRVERIKNVCHLLRRHPTSVIGD